ncbi:delta-1-pyrroline-5-carboxylate dehydrogenase, mitochondrial-like [Lingula anatina]|uniref:L-glutamate gamma-semialdehyde dehydrogenase n=1 Tax=Lingula anatina TaxID=7574 RepID=A0A1S3JXL0_LINAN|nr:delta-1-pyrroline-5-carboxylate dehydrogenase, mitochondrial-like [Lingula anatina]|eukprot:XP_013414789.1 delta-1-pyrroline-5-carboxylate dehydrogenase, mitochondrial-like [Lingula anatina]
MSIYLTVLKCEVCFLIFCKTIGLTTLVLVTSTNLSKFFVLMMTYNIYSIYSRHDYISLRSASFLKSYMATNEPVLDYAPGSGERMALEDALRSYEGKMTEVPVIVGDDQHFTDEFRYQLCPADHQRQVAKYHFATKELIQKAIDVSQKVRPAWEKKPLEERAEIFLKTADLMSTKYRADMNATSMIGQGKTIIQAEIDSACELIDFLRFNVQFAMDMAKYQPVCTPTDTNYLSFRGCEGFWAAITPFNFTAIGGHLPSAPAFMGNTVLWKPAGTAVLSNYTFYKILREAGLPPGVINFLPSSGPVFGETITSSPHLAGINFTGSVETYQRVTAMVTKNLHLYRTFPRLIGECGGKNFHLVHPSADVTQVVYHTIRAAFEYSGQKCSACSRLYVPHSLWPQIKDMFVEEYKKIKLGSPLEFDSFLSAVIDKASFQNIKSYLDYAKENPNLNIVVGGVCDDSKGWFVEPTIIETSDPKDKLMQEVCCLLMLLH